MFGRWDDGPGYDIIRGAVGDWCPDCDAVRLFYIEERMTEWLFVIWKIGSSRVGRRRVCGRCGYWQFTSGFEKGYAEWLPVGKAERMPVWKLLERTNPDLYDELYDD